MRLNWVIPEGWRETRVGTRHVLNGPNGEVVIASAARVSGAGSKVEKQLLVERAKLNMERSLLNTLCDPALVVEKALADEQISETALWRTCYASSNDPEGVFFAAIRVLNDEVVALVTYEGPPASTSRDFFCKLLSKINAN